MSGGKWGWVVSGELAIMANQHGNFALNLTNKTLLLVTPYCSCWLSCFAITPYHSLLPSLACQWRNFQNAIHVINSLNKVI